MALLARANANAALLTNNCFLLKLTSHDIMLRSIVSCMHKFSTFKEVSKCTCLVRPFERCNRTADSHKNVVRKCHIKPHNKNYMQFEETLTRRREEASRSIVVQVQSSHSHGELSAYCEQFGTVNSMHHYFVKGRASQVNTVQKHFYLVEFKDCASAEAAIDAAAYPSDEDVMPVGSKMFWFRNLKKSEETSTNNNSKQPSQTPIATSNLQIQGSSIDEILANSKTISEEMIALHEAWHLDEIDVRLRFLTAHQLQQSFVGLSPHLIVYPFGSSVNGFGKRGCDLDLVLILEDTMAKNLSSRLVFHTKSIANDSMPQSRIFLGAIADLMHYFMPGISNVKRILQARVPIIKYYHTLTGLECDLSMTNMSGVYMSELLCLYGEIDWRVRPLVFTVREWAKCVSITKPNPGPWITNFSLTLLVMFYLQQRKILPPLDKLKTLAGEDDVRQIKSSVSCTFLRDITKLPTETVNSNTESLETLLHGFFQFCSTFNFASKGISLRQGESIIKAHASSLYIENPLEPWMNVSKNVKVEETQRIISQARAAALVMEMSNPKVQLRHVFTTFNEKTLQSLRKMHGKAMIDVTTVFEMSDDENKTETKVKTNRKRRKN